MSVRLPVAVVVSRFPLVTETFILRELIEMERQGQPVRLVPLLRERAAVVHAEAQPWIERALYTPWISPGILADNARMLARAPGRYLATLARLVADALPSLNFLARGLALWPKTVSLAARLEAEGVGHVHAQFATHPATAALVIHSLTGIPFSVTAHAHDIFVRREGLRRKLARASFVRAISRFNAAFLSRAFPREAARGVRVIPVGVPAPGAEGREPAAEDARGRVPLLVCVAALKPYKGVAVLVDACAALRDAGVAVRCVVIGDGPLRRELAAQVARRGLEGVVELRGAQPQHVVQALMRQADLVAQPSVVAADGQMEGIPVALMEALAAGRPVVASALSGIPELVEDGLTGRLVPPGDAGALATAIRELLADPARAARLAEAGRERVRREFDLARTVGQLVGEIDRHRPPLDGPLGERVARSPFVAGAAAGIRRRHERTDSLVAEVLLAAPDGVRDAVCKLHRDHPRASRPAVERARDEYAVLRRAHAAFVADADAAGLGVPAPLALEEDAVWMERCAGRTLDAVLRAARTGGRDERARAERAVRACGRWLRAFQRHTAGPDLRSADPIATRAVDALARCWRGGLDARCTRRVRARIDDLAAAAASAPSCLQHGDYWPGNVFVSGGAPRVEVVDFEGARPGQPAEDAGYFLVHLALFHAHPLLARANARLAHAFVEGHGALDGPALDLATMAARLELMARAYEGRAPAVDARRRRWLLQGLEVAAP